MRQQLNNPWVVVLTVLVMACVPSKKFKEVQDDANDVKEENLELARTVRLLNLELADLTSQNESLKNEFTAYKTNCEATEQSFREVNDILAKEAKTMQRVEEKLQHAMADFRDRGVEVYTRQGLVHVSLSDELLYKTGSATLDDEGKKALASLASVLNDYPNLKVIIVGNTDNVQYKKGGDNWTLSTERANGVVRVLRDQYKVEPARLTSAGKAKYNPVADNTTPEGRSKNRRTDIILNPDIERIWNMARNEQ
jgi:chemotaxis protein MotB